MMGANGDSNLDHTLIEWIEDFLQLGNPPNVPAAGQNSQQVRGSAHSDPERQLIAHKKFGGVPIDYQVFELHFTAISRHLSNKTIEVFSERIAAWNYDRVATAEARVIINFDYGPSQRFAYESVVLVLDVLHRKCAPGLISIEMLCRGSTRIISVSPKSRQLIYACQIDTQNIRIKNTPVEKSPVQMSLSIKEVRLSPTRWFYTITVTNPKFGKFRTLRRKQGLRFHRIFQLTQNQSSSQQHFKL